MEPAYKVYERGHGTGNASNCMTEREKRPAAYRGFLLKLQIIKVCHK